MMNIKYDIPTNDYNVYKNYRIVILGKETTNFKTEIIYEPIYVEIKDENLTRSGKDQEVIINQKIKKPAVKEKFLL